MRLLFVFAAAGVLSCGLCAHADTITDFNFNASLDNGSVAKGTIMIDTTTGVVENSNFVLTDNGVTEGDFSAPNYQESLWGNAYLTQFADAAGDSFELLLPTASLQGYVGGTTCSETGSCDGYPAGVYLASGAETGVVSGNLSETPEPASLVLLGTGAMAFYLVRRRIV